MFRIDAPPRLPTLAAVTPPAASASPATTPPAIADYVLLRLIGRGSYGDVWLAHGVTGVHRAVKIVWRARFADAQPYEREFNGLKEFARVSLEESRQLALLHVGRGEDFFYYVMELADDAATGREIEPARYVPHTLRETLARRGRLPAGEVLGLAVDLARALAGLHTRRLVHRDIKPSNVIFVGGVPKLADIGLVATASAELTFVGTEGYVPPEGPGAPSADVFSLGKLLYELATGLDRRDYPRLPADLHTFSDRKPLLELNEILIRACEPDATRRHRDATALLDELQLLQAGKSVRRLRAAERHLGRALRAAAVLAVIAAVAGTGAWIEHRRAAEETAGRRAAEAQRDALARATIYSATISQAQRAMERDDFGRARQLLTQAQPSAGEPDLRGFEWHALLARAQGDPATVLRAQGAAIDRLALSPAGSALAVHAEDKTVTLYDPRSLRLLRTITGVQRLGGFSSDGHWLVGTTTTPPAAPQRWSAATGEPATPPPPRLGLRPIGPQGRDRLVAVIDARPAPPGTGRPARPLELVVWDFAQQQAVTRVPFDSATDGEPWQFFRSAILPDGSAFTLATVRGQGALAELRLTYVSLEPTPHFTHQVISGFLPSVLNVRSLPGQPPVWTSSEMTTGRQMAWDPSQGRWTGTATALPAGTTLATQGVLPDGNWIFHARNATIIADSPTGPRRFRGHDSLIAALAADPVTARLFSASQSGELRAWEIRPSSPTIPRRQCLDTSSRPTEVVYSSDGRSVFAPAPGGGVWRLDASTLEIIDRIPDLRRLIGIAGGTLWGITADGQALVQWDLTTKRAMRRLTSPTTPLVHGLLSSDQRWLCVQDQSGRVTRLDLSTLTPIDRPLADLIADSVVMTDRIPRALSSDGRWLWSGGRANTLECHEFPGGRPVWLTQLPATRTSMCRLAASGRIVVALENGDLQFYDERNGRLLLTTPSGSAAPQALFATADETRLFAAGIEGEMHVLATHNGAHLAHFPVTEGVPLHTGAVAPDASSIAVLTKNGLLSVLRSGP